MKIVLEVGEDGIIGASADHPDVEILVIDHTETGRTFSGMPVGIHRQPVNLDPKAVAEAIESINSKPRGARGG